MFGRRVTIEDWNSMKAWEKEAHVFHSLGMEKSELAKVVAEWEWDEGKKPNALYLPIVSLAEIPVRLKKVFGLQVIPMDSDPGQIIISQVDPWDWGGLFYS